MSSADPSTMTDMLDQRWRALEDAEKQLVRRLVPPGAVVFDVGANVGDYALLLADRVGSAGQVYAFEPTASTFAILQQRMAAAGARQVQLIPAAIYKEDTTLEFHEFSDEYAVCNTLGAPRLNVGKGGTEIHPVAVRRVSARSLDSFCRQHGIERVGYLKMDIEGAELFGLRGAVELLRRQAIDYLQFEVSRKLLAGMKTTPAEVFGFLYEHGYECHAITPEGDIGPLVINSHTQMENYLAFPFRPEKELPVHFLTPLYAPAPLLAAQVAGFCRLPLAWQWHLLIPPGDGDVARFAEALRALAPDRVLVHRVDLPAAFDPGVLLAQLGVALPSDALLWQIAATERWRPEQILGLHALFQRNPEKVAAHCTCRDFLLPELLVLPDAAPDEPRIWRRRAGGVGGALFSVEETQSNFLVFDRLEYASLEELGADAAARGHAGAGTRLSAACAENDFPAPLRSLLPWRQGGVVLPCRAVGLPVLLTGAASAAAPLISAASSTEPSYRVTALVSTYCGSRFLHGCLEDLIGQSLFRQGRLEIVVIDSASPEDEGSIVREFQRRHGGAIVYERSSQRETLYGAWNRGIRLCRGAYITNANVDDRHHPRALEILADALDAHPDVALVYADSDITHDENAPYETAARAGTLRWPEFDEETLFEECCIGPHPMWRRSVHDTVGCFDAAMATSGDYEFWLRLSLTQKFLHLPQTLGLYLENPGSVSLSNKDRAWNESEVARNRYWSPERGVHPKMKRSRAAFEHLAARIAAEPEGLRVALYGAGKHTQRMLAPFRSAVEPRSMLVGIIDDAPRQRVEIGSLPVVATERWAELAPSLVVVSSDTYEAAMAGRIRAVLPRAVQVWRVYEPHDPALAG